MVGARLLGHTLAVSALAAALALAHVSGAQATNATNLIGWSAASTAMGGADLATGLDTSAINTNPAALSLLQGRDGREPDGLLSAALADLSVGVLQPYLRHEDVFGARTSENEPFLALQGGVAARLRSLPGVTVGLGLFTQGGLGTDFRDLNTVFGTRDDVTSYLRYAKLAAAVSYQPTDRFAIGVAPHVGYSDLTLRLFPRTSSNGADGVPGTADDFAGIDIHDRCARNYGLGAPGSGCPWDVVFGVKVGAIYRLSPTVTLGAAYTSPVHFHYRHGTIGLNLSNVGLGRVTYDAAVDGFQWPQQAEVGVAVRPARGLLLALDVSWHDWSAFNAVKIRAKNPDRPQAPSEVELRLDADWNDQWVVAFGAAYEMIRDVFTVRAGYNFGNNPIPARTLSPPVQVTYQHHLTTGVGYRLARHWHVDASFVYALEHQVTYTNRALPFGPDAVESTSGFSTDFTLGYRF